jgi:hypothetical protein
MFPAIFFADQLQNEEVSVRPKIKTVWIAVGEYNGKHHEVKRSTPGAAAKG